MPKVMKKTTKMSVTLKPNSGNRLKNVLGRHFSSCFSLRFLRRREKTKDRNWIDRKDIKLNRREREREKKDTGWIFVRYRRTKDLLSLTINDRWDIQGLIWNFAPNCLRESLAYKYRWISMGLQILSFNIQFAMLFASMQTQIWLLIVALIIAQGTTLINASKSPLQPEEIASNGLLFSIESRRARCQTTVWWNTRSRCRLRRRLQWRNGQEDRRYNKAQSKSTAT